MQVEKTESRSSADSSRQSYETQDDKGSSSESSASQHSSRTNSVALSISTKSNLLPEDLSGVDYKTMSKKWKENIEAVNSKAKDFFLALKQVPSTQLTSGINNPEVKKKIVSQLTEEAKTKVIERKKNIGKDSSDIETKVKFINVIFQTCQEKAKKNKLTLIKRKRIFWALCGLSAAGWFVSALSLLLSYFSDSNDQNKSLKKAATGMGFTSFGTTATAAFAWFVKERSEEEQKDLEKMDKAEIDKLSEISTLLKELNELQKTKIDVSKSELKKQKDEVIDEKSIKTKFKSLFKTTVKISKTLNVNIPLNEIFVPLTDYLPPEASLKKNMDILENYSSRISLGSKSPKLSHLTETFESGKSETGINVQRSPSLSDEAIAIQEVWSNMKEWVEENDEAEITTLPLGFCSIDRQGNLIPLFKV